MRAVYRYWSTIVFIAVVVQVGFAGYGAFSVVNDVGDGGTVDETKLEDGFGAHIGFGYLVVLGGIVLFILALVARHRIKQSAVLFVLLLIQPPLAWAGGGTAAVGFFHPINALVIFGLSGYIAVTEWRGRQVAVAARALPAEPT